jgi:hypothetical protein
MPVSIELPMGLMLSADYVIVMNAKHSPALTSASDLLSRGNANFIAPSCRFSKPYPRNWVAGKPGGLYAARPRSAAAQSSPCGATSF